MKINKKGFTLVELLAVIAIIALVLGLTSFGVIKVLNRSKDKSHEISTNGIIEAAKVYGSENISNNSYWNDITDYDNKLFCVTIEELINKGLISKDSKLPDGIEKNNYVAIEKDKVASTITNGTIIKSNFNPEDDKKYLTMAGICSGTIANESFIIPSFKKETIYTDGFDIPFDNAQSTGKTKQLVIKKSECQISSDNRNFTSLGEVTNNKCEISNLKSGTYYVRVCQYTERKSRACNTEIVSTANVEKPDINIISDSEYNYKVNITFKTDNIRNKDKVKFYFSSPIDAVSDVDVFDGNVKTKTIVAGKEYISERTNLNLTYTKEGNGTVYAYTSDQSDNKSEKTSEYINVYESVFNKGTADKVGGSTSTVKRYCISEKNKTCKIKSPNIEKNNFDIVGWNDKEDGTGNNLSVNTDKNISISANYYPIITSHVNIYYNVYGGSITSSTPEETPKNFWKVDNAGKIQKSSSLNGTYNYYYQSIEHDKTMGKNGLANYNNSSSMEIKRTGYSVPSGKEWCLGVCKDDGVKFNQGNNTNYKSTDFCDTSKGNCSVILYVNWIPNTYTIDYRLGNNSATKGSSSIGNTSCTYDSNCKLENWSLLKGSVPFSDKGWSFYGWTNSLSGTTSSYGNGSTVSNLSSTNGDIVTLYALFKRNVTFYSGINKASSTTSEQHYNPYCYDTTNCKDYYTSTIIANLSSPANISGWAYLGYTSGTSATSTYYANSVKRGPASAPYYYAVYDRDISISYDKNGGSGTTISSSTGTQKYNSYGDIESVEFTLESNTYAKTGHKFNGWGTSSTSTSGSAAGSSYSFTNGVTAGASKTFYATWKANTYTISFNANGGSSAPNSQTKTYGVDLTLTTSKPSKTGYTFKGWSTSSTATSATYSSGGKYTSNSGATLYAVWKDETKPTITMSPTNSRSISSGTKLTLTCTDNGSGMKEADLNDNNTPLSEKSTKYPSSLSVYDTLSTCRTASDKKIKTVVTCIDKAGNTNTETYYYTVTGCSSGGGSSGGGSSCIDKKYCISSSTVGSDTECKKNSNYYKYSAGACWLYNKCTCPTGFYASNG